MSFRRKITAPQEVISSNEQVRSNAPGRCPANGTATVSLRKVKTEPSASTGSLFAPAPSISMHGNRAHPYAVPKAERQSPAAILALTAAPPPAKPFNFGWNHPSEFPLPVSDEWPDQAIWQQLTTHVYNIPPRVQGSFFIVTPCGPNDSTNNILGSNGVYLPFRYRMPLLWVTRWQWHSLKLVLTAPAAAREMRWNEQKMKILHISRLCWFLLEQAREAAGEEVGMDKGWRCPAFDRQLVRYRQRVYDTSTDVLKKFHATFGEEEFTKMDILMFDWKRWVLWTPDVNPDPILTEDDVLEGITGQQFMHGLVERGGVWTWDEHIPAPRVRKIMPAPDAPKKLPMRAKVAMLPPVQTPSLTNSISAPIARPAPVPYQTAATAPLPPPRRPIVAPKQTHEKQLSDSTTMEIDTPIVTPAYIHASKEFLPTHSYSNSSLKLEMDALQSRKDIEALNHRVDELERLLSRALSHKRNHSQSRVGGASAARFHPLRHLMSLETDGLEEVTIVKREMSGDDFSSDVASANGAGTFGPKSRRKWFNGA